jgi:hypothetical protein
MLHEVRVYDGQGNLKKTIQPVFDYEAKAIGNKTKKSCANTKCGKTSNLKGNQRYCSPDCARDTKQRKEKARRAERKKLEEAKPVVPCEICGDPVKGTRKKYCSEDCDQKARRMKAMNKEARTREIIRLKRLELANEKN